MTSKRFPIVLAVAGIIVVSLVVAAVAAGLSGSREVVCGTGNVLDRIAQAVTQPLGAGHIDGPAATYCVVPSTSAWVMAAIVFAAPTSGCVVVKARLGRSR